MPSRSGAVLPGWRMYPRFVTPSSAGGSCGRQTVGQSSCRVQGLRSVSETPPCRARRHGTASLSNPDFNSVHRDIHKKTQKSSIWLLAPLRTLSSWCYINIHIHSFKWYKFKHNEPVLTSSMAVSSSAFEYLNGIRWRAMSEKYSLASLAVEVPKPYKTANQSSIGTHVINHSLIPWTVNYNTRYTFHLPSN